MFRVEQDCEPFGLAIQKKNKLNLLILIVTI